MVDRNSLFELFMEKKLSLDENPPLSLKTVLLLADGFLEFRVSVVMSTTISFEFYLVAVLAKV